MVPLVPTPYKCGPHVEQGLIVCDVRALALVWFRADGVWPPRFARMRFEQATSVRARHLTEPDETSGTFEAAIAEDWGIHGNANGGYLVALAARAMAQRAGRPDPATITAHYLAPGKPGKILIETELVKEGRKFATVTASMRGAANPSDDSTESKSRPILQVMGAFTDLSAATGPELVDGSPPDLPPVQDCTGTDSEEMFSPEFFNQVEVRLHPDDARFSVRPSGEALTRGYFRLLDDEPMDAIALLLATDALPPTVFNANLPVSWVPTVELTAHVRAQPVPGWLRCEFRTRFVTGGFLEEDGLVWDESGRMVAQSRQLALIPQD